MNDEQIVTLIDVPSGWRYGFPIEIDVSKVTDIKQFVIDNGYPKEETEQEYFYVRMFNVPKSDFKQ